MLQQFQTPGGGAHNTMKNLCVLRGELRFLMNVLRIMLPLLALLPMAGEAQARERSLEYGVKAAFIYNFARFVEWPADSTEITLCILGENPFGAATSEVDGKSLGNRKFQVMQDSSVGPQCNIVFIGASEQGRLERILDSAGKLGILTIGDTPGFARMGVMINFYLDENGRVRFEINPESAGRAGLRISSKLIQLGKMVYTSK